MRMKSPRLPLCTQGGVHTRRDERDPLGVRDIPVLARAGDGPVPVVEHPQRRPAFGLEEDPAAPRAQVVSPPLDGEMPQMAVVRIGNETHTRHILEESRHGKGPFLVLAHLRVCGSYGASALSMERRCPAPVAYGQAGTFRA